MRGCAFKMYEAYEVVVIYFNKIYDILEDIYIHTRVCVYFVLEKNIFSYQVYYKL